MTPEGIANSLVAVMVLACVAAWAGIFRRRLRGEPVVAYEPRDPVAWTRSDFVAVLAILAGPMLLSVVMGQVMSANSGRSLETLSSAEVISSMLGTSVVHLLLLVLAVAWLKRPRFVSIVRSDDGASVAATERPSGRTWRQLGFATDSLVRDVRLGLAAFAALSVPIYVLQWALSRWIPGEHEIMILLERHPESGVFLACAFTAVVAAPISEEFLFRGVLQGWLETCEWSGMGEPTLPPVADDGPTRDGVDTGRDVSNPYVAPRSMATDATASRVVPTNRGMFGLPAGVAPVLISSMLFALAHLGDGPAPIPLFFLALVLGYLYRQTHRLWPSVVVHVSLNACSMAALWLDIALDS